MLRGAVIVFFRGALSFLVYGTHHHLQVFSIWYGVKTISWRIVRKADMACTMILSTYRPLPCPNTFSDLLSLSFRHGLSYWGAKVVLEVIVIWGRYRFKVDVRHHFRTATSYIGLHLFWTWQWPIYYAILSLHRNKNRKLPVLRTSQILLLINFCRGNPWHWSDVMTCSSHCWEPNPPAGLGCDSGSNWLCWPRQQWSWDPGGPKQGNIAMANEYKWCTGGVIPGSVPRNWNVKSSSPKCSASTKSTTCFMFYDTVLTRCPGISTMTPGALWYKLLISDRHAMSFFCWFFENTPCNILLATIPA